MHTLFIYNYLQKKAEFASPHIGPEQLSGSAGSPDDGVRLVDPCQLFHNLNNLVHCGFTLHAAAVIDLKSSK